MGDRRGELAHRRQPRHSLEVRPRVPQRLLGAFAFGDVDRDRGEDGRAPGNRRQKGVDLRPDYAAILAPVALLDVPCVGLARSIGRDDRLGGGLIVLVGDVGGREATEFCLGVAGHSLKGRVRRDVASVRTDQGDADGDAFEQFAPALLAHRQFAIEAGIFQRDRGLRRQQLQQRDPGGRENGRGHVVLEVEHADQLGLLDQRQAEDRPDAPGSDVFVRRERLFPGGVIRNHRLLGPDDILQYRQREFRGRHERLSEVDLNRLEAGRRFRLHP